MKQKLLGYYNYTVVLTYLGMMTGFLGIVCTVEHDTWVGIFCLMIAGVFDMFDGAVASTMKNRTDDEKCFGIQIDSLSDLICFGVLPAVILCSIDEKNEFTFAIAALYVLASLIRLAYFNVDEQNRQKQSDGNREIYYGLPVTSIAVILPFMFALGNFFDGRKGLIGNFAIFATGVLFLTPFRLKKPKIFGKIALGLGGVLEIAFLILSLGDV